MKEHQENECGPSLEGGRRPVKVTVMIHADGTFDLDSRHIPIQKRKGGPEDSVLTFSNWEGGQYSDGFDVTFEIADETGRGYGFFVRDAQNPDPNDAMSVRIVGPTGHCPKPGQTWDGFAPVEVFNDRQSLRVDNPNSHLQYFGFALHFSRDGEHRPTLTFDPIGDNQNGRVRF